MSSTENALKAEVDHLKLELHALQSKLGAGNTTVAGYLLTRLAQLGVTVWRQFDLYLVID